MKLFDEEHLQQVAAVRYPLFNHEQPPCEGVGAKMLAYLQALERTLSPKASRQESGLSMLGYEDCSLRSLWFCKMVNSIAAYSQDEAVWTTISRANGNTKPDEHGVPMTDADGKVLKFGVSDAAAKIVVEDRLRAAQLKPVPRDVFGEVANDLQLLPSNISQHRQLQIDDCRMALNALRPAVRAGDRQAIDSFTKVQDRLAKLQGTDAAIKQEVTYTNGSLQRLSDDELYALAAQDLTLLKGQDGIFSADE